MLNLIEYYSNSYKDYKSVVPSEILDKEQLHSHERVLPSSGTTYPIFTKVLADFGFSQDYIIYHHLRQICFQEFLLVTRLSVFFIIT